MFSAGERAAECPSEPSSLHSDGGATTRAGMRAQQLGALALGLRGKGILREQDDSGRDCRADRRASLR